MYQTIIFDYGNTLCQVGSLTASLEAILPSRNARTIGEELDAQILRLYTPDQKEQPDWLEVWEQAFKKFDEPFTQAIGIAHLQHFCASGTLYRDTKAMLSSLKDQGVTLVLLSNATGPEEVFWNDLAHRGILKFFDRAIWSCAIGYRKPSPLAFEQAIKSVGAEPSTTLVVGDSEIADIQGANNYGLDSLLVYNHPPDCTAARYSTSHKQLFALLKRLIIMPG
ncbi:HAD family hydrolase [Parendozoicomonas haliclonae]|uniref:Phosphoglycolate phosphatase n=1 Tax=Parendozoicomonas haliclonae TaxID=1960125 RepID=A0A1X7AK72_9GAMM|nr:HAD family hydrolase [Parendozoicomonas haliclonae]SMA47018.1 Phosphoglycolate phosphatase [Parendozoicomonas haliclonae]